MSNKPARMQPVLASDENRKLRRALHEPFNGFSAQIQTEMGEFDAFLRDLNSTGASLQLNAADFIKLKDMKVLGCKISFGTSVISTINGPSVVWRNEAESTIGMSFSNPFSSKGNRSQNRLKANENFKPIVFVRDPIDLAINLHFTVTDVSGGGLTLETSASNNHLLPGMTLKNAQLILPGIAIYPDLNLLIRYITAKENILTIGVSFIEVSARLTEQLAQFSMIGTSLSRAGPDQVRNLLAQAHLETKKLSQALRVEVVSSIDEYQKVLNVRWIAYRTASKIEDTTKPENMADEFDARSTILSAKYNGHTVATARLVRCLKLDDTFPCEKYFKLNSQIIKNRLEILEVSRLSVLPEFQGTDTLLLIFKKMIEFSLRSKVQLALCAATDSLLPTYKRIGWKQEAIGENHPVLKTERLNLLSITAEAMTRGKNIPATSWEIIAKETVNHLASFGCLEAPNNKLEISVRRSIEQAFLRLKKLTSKKRNTK
jgi:N-acyl-L-homoserine lactone synthetase